jgi:hypothetical protein
MQKFVIDKSTAAEMFLQNDLLILFRINSESVASKHYISIRGGTR